LLLSELFGSSQIGSTCQIIERRKDGTKDEFLEKWADKNGNIIEDMCMDIYIFVIKESMSEMMKGFKKSDKNYEGGENSVNDEEEKELRAKRRNQIEGEEEEEVRSWTKRVDLPMFEGSDPHRWVSRAEKLNVSAMEKLKLAFISMEGSANHWFSFRRKKAKNHSWEEFTATLIWRYGGKERSSVFEKLAKIKQKKEHGRLYSGI